MNKFWDVLRALLYIVWFVGYAINNVWDFTHPGREPRWMHNPWWNAAGGVFFFSIIALCYWSEWKSRWRSERDARLRGMILVVKELFKVGRREEGEKAHAIYHRFKAAGSKQEADALAKQFSDLCSL